MSSKISFAPLADGDTEILILGSMPGERSLAMNEYYGHPRNRFWHVVAALCGVDTPVLYADKKALLRRARIGLWDVAHRAVREGSLDSAIRDAEPNDIPGFIAEHRRLRIIAFNGRKSEEMYDRHFARISGIEYIYLPSTSPANAAFTLEKLLDEWRRINDLRGAASAFPPL
jgi:hypoxanthine-DNA glycosylase